MQKLTIDKLHGASGYRQKPSVKIMAVSVDMLDIEANDIGILGYKIS
jgi:hypothetical protein